MLWEQFRELARINDTAKRTDDYGAKLTDAERVTDSLRQLLSESTDGVAVDAAFKKSGQKCAVGHTQIAGSLLPVEINGLAIYCLASAVGTGFPTPEQAQAEPTPGDDRLGWEAEPAFLPDWPEPPPGTRR